VWGGETVVVAPQPAPGDASHRPEDIPLRVVFEDDQILVIDKPAGMVRASPAAATGAARVKTPCSDTHRNSPACREPASYTDSTRTPAVCWWWQKQSPHRSI